MCNVRLPEPTGVLSRNRGRAHSGDEHRNERTEPAEGRALFRVQRRGGDPARGKHHVHVHGGVVLWRRV